MEHANDVASSPDAQADAYAELAYVAAITGNSDRAEQLLRDAKVAMASTPQDLGATLAVICSDAMVALADGRPDAADQALDNDIPTWSSDIETQLRVLFLRGSIATVRMAPDAQSIAEAGLERMAGLGAVRMQSRLELIRAAANGDPESLRHAMMACTGSLALLEVADVIGSVLPLWDPVPLVLTASIEAWPQRWLPVLRRQVRNGNAPVAHAAARLLRNTGRFPMRRSWLRSSACTCEVRVLGHSVGPWSDGRVPR